MSHAIVKMFVVKCPPKYFSQGFRVVAGGYNTAKIEEVYFNPFLNEKYFNINVVCPFNRFLVVSYMKCAVLVNM